jgi:hypothetical protein
MHLMAGLGRDREPIVFSFHAAEEGVRAFVEPVLGAFVGWYQEEAVYNSQTRDV